MTRLIVVLLLTLGISPVLATPVSAPSVGEASADATNAAADDDTEEAGTPVEAEEGDDGDEGREGDAGDAPAAPAPPPDDEARPAAETSLGTLDEPSTVAIERTDQADRTVRPMRLGPARIDINQRGDRIGIGLATQMRFEFEQTFAAEGVDEDSDSAFSFRRLRTLLSSAFLEGRVRSSLQLNLLPDGLELIDLWLLFAPIDQLAVRVGQFKIPFTRYRLQSFAALSLADWSPASPMFGGERQLGLELLNPTAGKLGWEYAAGVFTGANARSAHGVGITRVYGESPVNPSDLTSHALPAELHPELVARVAKNFAAIDTSTNSDVARGPLRSSVGLNVAWDIDPQERADLAVRGAVEWLAKLYGFYVNAIGYISWFEGREGIEFGPWGILAEGGYRFNRVWELALRYTHIVLTQALRDDAKAYAAEQIGDGSDPEKTEQYGSVGEQKSDQELALALNAYVIGNSVKLQLETAWTTAKTEVGRHNQLSVIAQLQFQF